MNYCNFNLSGHAVQVAVVLKQVLLLLDQLMAKKTKKLAIF